MTVMLITFGAFISIIAVMSIGVIFANKPIKGSCGGLSNLGLKDNCPICGGDDKAPLAKMPGKSAEGLFYDAAARQS